MAHELDLKEDGQARMFSGRGITPWHKLGVVVKGLLTAEEAIVAAGLNWQVTLEPAFRKRRGSGAYEQVDGRFFITRDEDERVLGSVSKRYVPVQNQGAFDFVDSLLDAGEATLDSAGALKGGRRVWISALMPNGVTVGGEEHRGYLLLSNSHDGLSALTGRIVMTRVVCANTEAMAFGEAVPVWSVPHVEGVLEKLAAARETLKLSTRYMNEYRKVQEQLLASKVEMREVAGLLEASLPDRQRTPKNVEAVRQNLLGSPTIPDEMRKTGYGLLQAATEWQQWLRPSRSLEGRMLEVVDGEGSRTRDRLTRALLTR